MKNICISRRMWIGALPAFAMLHWASAKAAESAIERKNLGMTPAQFRQDFDGMAGRIEKAWQLKEVRLETGGLHELFSASIDAVARLKAPVDKRTGKLLELTLAVGSDQREDIFRAIGVMQIAAQVTTAGASQERISNAVGQLLSAAMDRLDQAGKSMDFKSKRVGNRRYSVKVSKSSGLVFTISNAGH